MFIEHLLRANLYKKAPGYGNNKTDFTNTLIKKYKIKMAIERKQCKKSAMYRVLRERLSREVYLSKDLNY